MLQNAYKTSAGIEPLSQGPDADADDKHDRYNNTKMTSYETQTQLKLNK